MIFMPGYYYGGFYGGGYVLVLIAALLSAPCVGKRSDDL